MEISLDKVKTRSDPYQLFVDSIRSPSTERRYKNLLHTFLKLIPNQIYIDNLGKTPKEKWSEKPVFAFSLSFVGDRLNLNCKNIGNGLAKNIELIIKTKGNPSLKPELKITHSGLGKGDHFLINNWQMHGWVGVGYYDFDCEISGTYQDIFEENHSINEKMHFKSDI